MQSAIKVFAQLNVFIGLMLMALPVGYLFAINTPQIWYRINPNAVEDEIRALTRDPFAQTLGSVQFIPKVFAEASQPDENLPRKNTLRINGIGIDTEILEGSDEHAILSKGVWRLPAYGTAANNDKPIILAAHRWGPTNISADYRNKNMFINLPELQPGDSIEIIWNQRSYKYKVRKVETTSSISELADLILMTCKYFDHPDRIMVYAERVG